MRSELDAILSYMDALAAVNVEGVPPMTHAVEMRLALRADEVAGELPVEVALGGAVKRVDDFFVVPRVVDKAGA